MKIQRINLKFSGNISNIIYTLEENVIFEKLILKISNWVYPPLSRWINQDIALDLHNLTEMEITVNLTYNLSITSQ